MELTIRSATKAKRMYAYMQSRTEWPFDWLSTELSQAGACCKLRSPVIGSVLSGGLPRGKLPSPFPTEQFNL